MNPASTQKLAQRRLFLQLTGASALGASLTLSACATTPPAPSAAVDPAFVRTVVRYDTREAPGTLVVDPQNHFLYLVQKGGQAVRYGVGVGAEGFGWSGAAKSKSSAARYFSRAYSGLWNQCHDWQSCERFLLQAQYLSYQIGFAGC